MIAHASAAAPLPATVEAYERLREHVLVPGTALAHELGLSVLLRDGMLAWVHTRRTCRQQAPSRRTGEADAARRRPSSLQQNLVQLLVAMASTAAQAEHGSGVS